MDSSPLKRQRLFGLDFVDAASEAEVAESITRLVVERAPARPGRRRVVVTPNVDQLVRRDRQQSLTANRVGDTADIVLPDGQPVIWASGWLKRPLRSRLTGSGVVSLIWPALVDKNCPTVVIAPSDDIAERIRNEAPHALALTPPLLKTEDDNRAYAAQVAEQIVAHNPVAVFVTLGFPKQCVLIEELSTRFPDTWYFAIGGSFEMYYGIKRRAPQWMQRVGLEWFHRFLLEPKRMFRRYFVDDPTFIKLVWRERRVTNATATTEDSTGS